MFDGKQVSQVYVMKEGREKPGPHIAQEKTFSAWDSRQLMDPTPVIPDLGKGLLSSPISKCTWRL